MFEILDKVWVHDGDAMFPGIVVSIAEDGITVTKFDTVIWRNVFVHPSVVTKRDKSFSDFMWEVRQRFITVPIKYYLP